MEKTITAYIDPITRSIMQPTAPREDQQKIGVAYRAIVMSDFKADSGSLHQALHQLHDAIVDPKNDGKIFLIAKTAKLVRVLFEYDVLSYYATDNTLSSENKERYFNTISQLEKKMSESNNRLRAEFEFACAKEAIKMYPESQEAITKIGAIAPDVKTFLKGLAAGGIAGGAAGAAGGPAAPITGPLAALGAGGPTMLSAIVSAIKHLYDHHKNQVSDWYPKVREIRTFLPHGKELEESFGLSEEHVALAVAVEHFFLLKTTSDKEVFNRASKKIKDLVNLGIIHNLTGKFGGLSYLEKGGAKAYAETAKTRFYVRSKLRKWTQSSSKRDDLKEEAKKILRSRIIIFTVEQGLRKTISDIKESILTGKKEKEKKAQLVLDSSRGGHLGKEEKEKLIGEVRALKEEIKDLENIQSHLQAAEKYEDLEDFPESASSILDGTDH